MTLSGQQHELRRYRIGASEIGALIDYFAPTDGLRVDPHKTAFDVFAERDCPSGEARDHQTWGLFQEPAILGFFAHKNGLQLLPSPGTLLHPKIGALCATPDGLARRPTGRLRNLQAKNAQHHQAWRWGEAGTDDMPLLYVSQQTTELGVLLAQGGDLAGAVEDEGDTVVSLGGAPPVGFPIRFDPELFGRLAILAEKFVRDHIVAGKPPAVNASTVDSAAEWIKRKYPAPKLKLLTPTEEDRALVQLVASMRKTVGAAEDEKKQAEVALKMRLGEAEGFEGLCTYKKNKDSIGPDWEKIALSLDAEKAVRLARAPEFLTITREGARVLRITNGKEK